MACVTLFVAGPMTQSGNVEEYPEAEMVAVSYRHCAPDPRESSLKATPFGGRGHRTQVVPGG